MVEIWYALVSFMLMMFIILEGFDIGAGMLQYIVGKTDIERRTVIAAIGPLWSWHEVWLVAFGGTLLVAFPTALGVSFSGFYLALFMLLWTLVLRGISIEFSGHLTDPLWRTGWHTLFVVANILLAILIGAALGNVLRGVPLGPSGTFSLSLFTNLSPIGKGGKVGILDWYTVSVAVFFLITFIGHGANGLAYRTEGPVHERSLQVAALAWKIVMVMLGVITIETLCVRPTLYVGMAHHIFGWLGLIAVGGGIYLIFKNLKSQNTAGALLGSSVFIAGMVIAGAAAAFPHLLMSTVEPKYSMSAYDVAAHGHGLALALVWWPFALIFAICYFLFIHKHYSSKVNLVTDTQTPY